MSIFPSIARPILAVFLAAVVAAGPVAAKAAELEKVSFQAPRGTAFKVVMNGQTQSVGLAELESLGLYRVRTTSPWEVGTLTFEGPLFRDVVNYLGLADARAVILRAADGFTAEIPRTDWLDGPMLLATRREGKLLTRRDQGPTRVVYPQVDHPAYADPAYKSRWIWLIVSLEPVS
jgi:hypothetical protein